MNKKVLKIIKNSSISILIFIVATVLGWQFRELGFTEPNIVVIYILAVLLVARFTEGYFYGIISCIISILGFNYFFTAPYHTFNVYDANYFVTFAIMAITSVITSTLTSKEKLYTKKAEEKERESRTLYTLTNELSDADTIEKIIRIVLSNIYELLQVDIGFIYFESKDSQIFIQQTGKNQVYRDSEETAHLWNKIKNSHTEFLEDNGYMNFSVNGNERLLGILRINKELGFEVVQEKSSLLHSMIENAGMALDRVVAANERIRDREAVVRERYRANLLRAISHDLRTPLTAIMGTAEMLMDMTEKSDLRYESMQGIYKDADWLHSLVENILSLTRLQDGKMVVKKQPEAMEEVVASAVNHTEKIYKERQIQVTLPDDFKLVPMDAKLIEQVITNLLDNSVKHTSKNQNIYIFVYYDDEYVTVSIEDEGDGISEKDEPNIFQMFYTTKTKSPDAKKGIGLGLAICETVIKAHGGIILGGNRKDKRGARFTFKLPLLEGESIV